MARCPVHDELVLTAEVERLAAPQNFVRLDRHDQAPHRHRRRLELVDLLFRDAVLVEKRRHPLQELFGLLIAAADEVALALVDDHLRAADLLDATGQPVVVRVDVGDQEPLDIGEGEVEVSQLGLQRVEGLGCIPAGVDQRIAVVAGEEIGQHPAQWVVRNRYLELVETGEHLFRHECDLLNLSSCFVSF